MGRPAHQWGAASTPLCSNQLFEDRNAEFPRGLCDGRISVGRLDFADPRGLSGGAVGFHRYTDIGKSTVATARRPVLLISMRLTSITRPSGRTTSSGVAVTRPARSSAAIVLRVKP